MFNNFFNYNCINPSFQLPVKGFEQIPDAKLGLPYEYTPKEGSVEVQPFVGAHNTIGIDEMTIKIEEVTPTVENFKHIKSFPYLLTHRKYFLSLSI
ncbi:DUF3888 domain-containing protein [Clostridium sp. JN-9]|nr:DUF3888 domain-containing protein [Clostridium sp. JN-9]